MNPEDTSFSVREFSSTKPKIRDDLLFQFDTFNNVPYCIIEDPLTSQFYRIGIAEYNFIKQLDGTKSIAEALAEMALESRTRALNEREALQIINWLLEENLIKTERSTRAEFLTEKKEKTTFKKLPGKINPIYIRIPLLNPNNLLTYIIPFFRFFFNYPFFLLWLTIVGTGVYIVFSHWNAVVISATEAILPNNWFWLALTWICLKAIHELWHSLACKYFNLNVYEAGIIFILFFPLTYVDATSAWRLHSKWKRILIGLAGLYIESFLAGIACIIWLNTEPGYMNSIAYNVIFMGGFVTLFFNINPLMRFDGYYILSDYLEIPNLYSQGQQRLMLYARRFLLGITEIQLPNLLKKENLIITLYGILAFGWRILVITTLLISSLLLFKGFGIILAAIAFFAWLFIPLSKLFKYIRHGNEHEQPRPHQYWPRIAGLLVIVGLIAILPYRPTFKAYAVIYNLGAQVLHAESPGFIEKIYIKNPQPVTENEILMQLSNDEETTKLQNLKRELEQTRIQAQLYLSQNKTASYQSELSTISALHTQIKQLSEYVDTLSIKAPFDGIAIPYPEEKTALEKKPGDYIKTGTDLYTVNPDFTTKATILIDQENANEFVLNLAHPIELKLKGVPEVINGVLTKIVPRATTKLPHPALSAKNRGPLPVIPDPSDPEAFKLTIPYFVGSVTLTPPNDITLHEGQTGVAKFKSPNLVFLYETAYKGIRNFIEKVITRSKKRMLSK